MKIELVDDDMQGSYGTYAVNRPNLPVSQKINEAFNMENEFGELGNIFTHWEEETDRWIGYDTGEKGYWWGFKVECTDEEWEQFKEESILTPDINWIFNNWSILIPKLGDFEGFCMNECPIYKVCKDLPFDGKVCDIIKNK